jgi:arylsulfatase B
MKKSLLLFLTPLIALPLLASTASEKPNIIFIFSDDMGYGDLGYTGSSQIKTPNLDKLAKDGIIFPQAYVTASVCGPSRAGVLTGRYQQRFGFETNPRGGPNLRPEAIGLPDRELTLGNRMQEAGYHTAAIGKWHMGYTDNFYPTERGFDYFFGMRGGGHRYHVTLEPMENIWYRDFGLERMGKKLDKVEVPYLTDWLTEDAINYISRREENDEQPWFVYLAYNSPHGPLQAKEEDIVRYQNVEPIGRRTYCAMVDCLDQNVGRLTEHLKKTGEADNTVIIFMNDNGGSTETVHALNAPFWGHKGTFWEGGIRVPMFVYGLDIVAQDYPHPVSALDIMPTMMALGGKPFEPETITKSRGRKETVTYDGVNLLPYLQGKMKDARPHKKLFWRMMPSGSAMRDGDWKLIFTSHQPPQLYDLVRDPAERNDVAAKNPAVVASMMEAHGNWCNSFERPPIWLGIDNHSRLHQKEYQLNQPEVAPK